MGGRHPTTEGRPTAVGDAELKLGVYGRPYAMLVDANETA